MADNKKKEKERKELMNDTDLLSSSPKKDRHGSPIGWAKGTWNFTSESANKNPSAFDISPEEKPGMDFEDHNKTGGRRKKRKKKSRRRRKSRRRKTRRKRKSRRRKTRRRRK